MPLRIDSLLTTHCRLCLIDIVLSVAIYGLVAASISHSAYGRDAEPRSNIHAGEVIAVIDGDTIDILAGDEPVRIRLEGIDAPEDGQAFGAQAKQALSRAIFAKHIEAIEVDRDRWGWIIGRVHIGKRDVNLAMIRAGMAWHYIEFSDEKALADAQAEAKDKRRGLWRDDDPTPPWEYRKQQRTEAAE